MSYKDKAALLKEIAELEQELTELRKTKKTYSREEHLELLKQQEYLLAKDSLYAFLKYSWHSFEGKPFKESKCAQAIAEHAEAVYSGEIKKLVVNVPPRSLKSSLMTRVFPAWYWIKIPETKIFNISYNYDLATGDAVISRNILTSDWYKQGKSYWDIKWELSKDNNTKSFYSNTEGGFRFATSTGGTLTGRGADLIIVDDILNAKDADSKIEREKANTWFKKALSSRFNDVDDGRMIIIAQRLHESDICGYVLNLNELKEPSRQYVHLNLPMLFNPDEVCETRIGFRDWRTKKDEILLPERFTEEGIETLKIDTGLYEWAAQYQQNPAPIEGGLFKRDWFPTYYVLPQWFDASVIAFDLSMVDTETADETAAVVIGRSGGKYYVIESVSARMDVWAQVELIKRMSEKYPFAAKLIEAKANGNAVMDMLRNTIPGIISIEPRDFGGSKEARASAVVPLCYSRSVYIPDINTAPWLNKLMEQLLWFPKAKRDDLCFSPITEVLTYSDDITATSDYKSMIVKPIKDVVVGDYVLTHKCRWKKVTAIMKRDYDGELLKVKVGGSREILLTPEHKVLASRSYHWDNCKQYRKYEYAPDWIAIKDLKKGDCLLDAIDNTIEDIEILDLAPYVKLVETNNWSGKYNITDTHIIPNNPKGVSIKRYIEVNEDLCRLMGYYVAKGSNNNSHQIRLAFNSNEIDYHEDVITLLSKCFNIKARISTRKENNCTTIVAGSKILMEFFKQFGRGASNKHIPMWILHLPLYKQVEFIKGYWRGDGCYANHNNSYILTTSSYSLSQGMRMLLYRLSIGCTYSISRKNGGLHQFPNSNKISKTKPLYHLCITNKHAYKFSLSMEDTNFKIDESKKHGSVVDIFDGYTFKCITQIKPIPYKGDVYNLEVEDDESYQTESFLAHNCDSYCYALLWLSLKCKQIKLPIEFESLKSENSRQDIRQSFNNSVYNTVDVTPTVLRGYFDEASK